MCHDVHKLCGCCDFSNTCRLLFMMVLTLIFFVIEIVSGFLTRSVALVADSAHMLSDSGALLIALFSVRISKRRSSKNTFGWVRAEILGALINAVFLLALCISIATQAIKRFVHFEEIEENFWLIVVGVIGLLINLLGLFVLQGHHHHHSHGHHHHHHSHHQGHSCCGERKAGNGSGSLLSQEGDGMACCSLLDGQDDAPSLVSTSDSGGHNCQSHECIAVDTCKHDPIRFIEDCHQATDSHTHSASQMNIKGAALHVFNDALGSVVVILSGLCIRYIPDRYKWKHYFDPIMSLMMVALIISFTIPLLKEAVLVLLQTVPTHIKVDQLQTKLLAKVNGVVNIQDLHVWQLCGMKIIASAHVKCQSLGDYMRVADEIKQFFHDEGIHSTTIQPEFVLLNS